MLFLSSSAQLVKAVVSLLPAAVSVHMQLCSLKTLVSLIVSADSSWASIARLPPHHSVGLGVFFVCLHQCSHAPLIVMLCWDIVLAAFVLKQLLPGMDSSTDAEGCVCDLSGPVCMGLSVCLAVGAGCYAHSL